MESMNEERLEEVRYAARRGVFAQWRRSLLDSMHALGVPHGYTAAEWAALPWYGPLEAWLQPGSAVSDILINGPHRDVVVIDNGMRRTTGEQWHPDWIVWLQQQLGLRAGLVCPDNPDDWGCRDTQLQHWLYGTADGRLRFALTRHPATPIGRTISIRVLPEAWWSLDDLIKKDVITREAAELLLYAVHHGATVIVAGNTGSGKTTLTAALLQAVAETKRIIVIEDAQELPQVGDGFAVEVLRSNAPFDAWVRLALRQKPDLIVLGEVRGAEALEMLRAAATGHPGICTLHAPDCEGALLNLERMTSEHGHITPAMVRSMMTSGIVPLVVVHIGAREYGGRRRVGRIDEVRVTRTSDPGAPYPLNRLFTYQPEQDRLVKIGNVSSTWGWGIF